MPLPTPILDDRSYQQLRDELVRRIPVYNPEWTDHNPSDPGITLLELFSFLGENVLYRFNQIPESTKLAFLRLLRVPLRPAVPAQAMVSLRPKQPAAPGSAPTIVPLGTEVRAAAIPFETRTEVTVAPWRLVAVAKAASPPPATAEAKDFSQAALDALGGLAAGEKPAYYVNAPVPDDPTAPGAPVVDFGATVDGILWIAVVGDPGYLADLAAEESSINVGFVPDNEIRPTDPPPDPCPGMGAALPRLSPCQPADAGGAGPASEIVWQASTRQLDASKQPVYRTLVVTGDTTDGLRRRGVVRLRVPRDAATGKVDGATGLPDPSTALGVPEPGDQDLRGTGSFPPELDDKDDRDHTVLWLRAWHRAPGAAAGSAPDPQHRFGRVLWIGPNAAETIQQRRLPPEFLGTGTGQAGQGYRLVNRPVVDGSLVVEVEESPGRWVRWSAVDGFEAAAEDDKVYAVDLEAGEVRFGNGVQGFAPQLGQRIRAAEYRTGGGASGNLAAKAIRDVVSPPGGPSLAGLEASNPLPASGGADPEPVAAALERIPAELRRHDRAVCAGDFRELALATPGADVGRAECLGHFDPVTGSTNAAGVVTVVVWPREDRKHPGAPMPDRTALARVCAWLDPRRLITTELRVVPPRYVPIAVSIGVHVKPGYGVDAVRSWVELVVRQYLAPLPPYGPDGQGWPLGRPVIAPELAAAALQVEGVEYIEDGHVKVAQRVGDAWQVGSVLLQGLQMPEVALITVLQMKGAGDQPLDPGKDYPAPPLPGKVIPIPTLTEEC